MQISILNADDHSLLRKGVLDGLKAQDDFKWLGRAGDGEEELEKTRMP